MTTAQRTKTVDLKEYRDLDLDSVTLRVTGGTDILDAAARCAPDDDHPIPEAILGITMRQQLIAGSITAFTLRDSTTPTLVKGGTACLESLSWSTRTREYVGMIYDHLNGMEKEERENFQEKLRAGG